jgi:hypothetical protein
LDRAKNSGKIANFARSAKPQKFHVELTEISDSIFAGDPKVEKAPFALSARIALGFGVRSRRATGTAPKASARRPSRTRPRRDPRLERGRGTWRPRCRARCPRTKDR